MVWRLPTLHRSPSSAWWRNQRKMATPSKRRSYRTVIYMLSKAAHLVALFVWIGGMVAVALALRYPVLSFLKQLRTHDRVVTSPAMVAAWAFGIMLAVQGGWFANSWLAAKIFLVLVLSGLHGVLAGRLRRATAGTTAPEESGRLLLPIGLVLVALIVLLVTLKPLSSLDARCADPAASNAAGTSVGSSYSGRIFPEFWHTHRTVRRRAEKAFHDSIP